MLSLDASFDFVIWNLQNKLGSWLMPKPHQSFLKFPPIFTSENKTTPAQRIIPISLGIVKMLIYTRFLFEFFDAAMIMMLLASQDTLEVTWVSEWVSVTVSTGPFFHQVIVPKKVTFYPKLTIFVGFPVIFVIIILKITKMLIKIIMATIIIIISIFFHHTRKTSFLSAGKKSV